MPRELDGRVALVTGAGRGIGRATALLLAELGASVACIARSRSEIEDVAATIRKTGGTAVALPVDLAESGAAARIVSTVARELGHADILVNNAATVDPMGEFSEIDPDAWGKALLLNVVSPVTLTRMVIGPMLERKWGRIVDISSGVVANPAAMPTGNAYITSKTALEAHALGLAAEIDGSGVTCNVLRPGTVDTAMQKWIRDQPVEKIGSVMHDRFLRLHEGGKLVDPVEPARVLVDLVQSGDNGRVVDFSARTQEQGVR